MMQPHSELGTNPARPAIQHLHWQSLGECAVTVVAVAESLHRAVENRSAGMAHQCVRLLRETTLVAIDSCKIVGGSDEK